MQLRGRLTGAQRRALDELLPLYSANSEVLLDAAQLFGRSAPLGIEIGFGTGDALIHWATAQPDWNLLGVEIYPPGIGALLNRIEEDGVENVRIVQGRAEDVVEKVLSRASVAEVRIFFPDPWPKKRHHKRRLIQPAFVERLMGRMAVNGELHFATDWEPYALWATGVFAGFPELAPVEAANAQDLRPPTRFEQRGHRLGHQIFEFQFKKQG